MEAFKCVHDLANSGYMTNEIQNKWTWCESHCLQLVDIGAVPCLI